MQYRKGGPLTDNRGLLNHVGSLLAIQRSLRLLFPHIPRLQLSRVDSMLFELAHWTVQIDGGGGQSYKNFLNLSGVIGN